MDNIKISRKMICLVQPFAPKQYIYAYQDGNKIDAEEVDTDEIINTIFKFHDKYYITDISFSGPYKYAKGIGKKVEEKFLTDYDRKIEVKYLDK